MHRRGHPRSDEAAGRTGKAKLPIAGKGDLLPLPPMSVTELPLRLQLVNGDGDCWAATLSTPFANAATEVKARSD